MSFLASAVAALALLQSGSAPLQRVHLRNGDYLDGRIQSETPLSVVVRLDDGLILLSKSQVTRIESISLRNHVPPPAVPAPGAAGASGPGSSIKVIVIVPSHIVGSVKFKVDAILDALRRKSIDRADALRRLVECGPEGALHLAGLLEKLEPNLRDLAVQSLSAVRNPATLGSMVELSNSPDPHLRVAAATVAGQLGEKDAAAKLRPLLKDRFGLVRAAAVRALEQLDDPDSLEALAPLCSDPDPDARAAALDATIKLAQRHELRENMLLALDRALRWPAKDTETDILKAIGACGDPEAWTIAAGHLASSNEKIRAAAAMAIGSLEAPEAAKAITTQMGAELKPEPRVQLAIAAERIRIAEAAPTLVEWLSDDNESVRRAALRALRSISAQELSDDPAVWKEWLGSKR